MRFCKDCRNYNDIGMLCTRGKRDAGFNAVTGSQEYSYTVLAFALIERKSIWPWRCGKNGRYFERSNAQVVRRGAAGGASERTEG